jgi:hypothetical protein
MIDIEANRFSEIDRALLFKFCLSSGFTMFLPIRKDQIQKAIVSNRLLGLHHQLIRECKPIYHYLHGYRGWTINIMTGCNWKILYIVAGCLIFRQSLGARIHQGLAPFALHRKITESYGKSNLRDEQQSL